MLLKMPFYLVCSLGGKLIENVFTTLEFLALISVIIVCLYAYYEFHDIMIKDCRL